jgi:hypothetical protein
MAIAVMCALALASGTAGVAIDRMVLRTKVSKLILPDTGYHPLTSIIRSPTVGDRRRVRTQLADELGLTPTQVTTVDSILDAHVPQFDSLREEIRPRVEHLSASVRADVERVLTPAQRESYRRLLGQGADPGRDSTRPPR